MITKMLIEGGGTRRLVNLTPAFFDRKVPISVPKRAHDFAHDTAPLISDIVIFKGNKVFYEKHYPTQPAMKTVNGRTEGQKQVVRLLRKEHKRDKLKVTKLSDIRL